MSYTWCLHLRLTPLRRVSAVQWNANTFNLDCSDRELHRHAGARAGLPRRAHGVQRACSTDTWVSKHMLRTHSRGAGRSTMASPAPREPNWCQQKSTFQQFGSPCVLRSTSDITGQETGIFFKCLTSDLCRSLSVCRLVHYSLICTKKSFCQRHQRRRKKRSFA